MYLVYAFAGFGALVSLALLAGMIWLWTFLRGIFTAVYVGVPHISGKVVDVVNGHPLPGMDVCLLETYTYQKFAAGYERKVRRSELTRTDAAGMFSFAASKIQRGLREEWDGYGIAVTDPAARWNGMCGRSTNLLGGSVLSGNVDLFRNEVWNPAKNGRLPYFPLAIVPGGVHPLVHEYGWTGPLPDAVLVRNFGDPGRIKVELIPLLPDASGCQLAKDPGVAGLCRQANNSSTADNLRKFRNAVPESR